MRELNREWFQVATIQTGGQSTPALWDVTYYLVRGAIQSPKQLSRALRADGAPVSEQEISILTKSDLPQTEQYDETGFQIYNYVYYNNKWFLAVGEETWVNRGRRHNFRNVVGQYNASQTRPKDAGLTPQAFDLEYLAFIRAVDSTTNIVQIPLKNIANRIEEL